MPRTQWEVAHLAFDAAWIAAPVAGDHTFLQNLVKDAVMKLFPEPRGE
jgi:hypothetical protein